MNYLVFFSIEAIGRVVDSANPETCSDADTYSELFGFLKIEGDFFGLIDSNKVCLQVMYESEKDRYWFEIPRPDLRGCYGSYFSFDDAADVLKSLPKTFPLDGLPGFKFTSWQ